MIVDITKDEFDKETPEKLNAPDVRERLIERRSKLQIKLDYYNKCIAGGCSFTDYAKILYREIPLRITELNYILENIV
jgi:hypothetical protein